MVRCKGGRRERLKLETPWDDDEDEDPPNRREEDDDSEPDEDDDEEPLRVKKEPRSAALLVRQDSADYCSPMTATVMVTVTSVCRTTWIGNSPTCLSGPCDIRTWERSTSCPCFSRASTTS